MVSIVCDVDKHTDCKFNACKCNCHDDSNKPSPYKTQGYRKFRALMSNGLKYSAAMKRLTKEEKIEARAGMSYNQRQHRRKKISEYSSTR